MISNFERDGPPYAMARHKRATNGCTQPLFFILLFLRRELATPVVAQNGKKC